MNLERISFLWYSIWQSISEETHTNVGFTWASPWEVSFFLTKGGLASANGRSNLCQGGVSFMSMECLILGKFHQCCLFLRIEADCYMKIVAWTVCCGRSEVGEVLNLHVGIWEVGCSTGSQMMIIIIIIIIIIIMSLTPVSSSYEDIGGVPSMQSCYSAGMKRCGMCMEERSPLWVRRSKSEETLCRLLITMVEETFDISRSWVDHGRPVMNLKSGYVEGENSKWKVKQRKMICGPFPIGCQAQ